MKRTGQTMFGVCLIIAMSFLNIASAQDDSTNDSSAGATQSAEGFNKMMESMMKSMGLNKSDESEGMQPYGANAQMLGAMTNPMNMMNPMSMMGPMSMMMNPMAMMNPMMMGMMNPMMMGGQGGMNSNLGAAMMMNPENWLNPKTYSHMMSPAGMEARMNPMNWMSMMNPATYSSLMNYQVYMSLMNQMMNPAVMMNMMSETLMKPEMYTQWYEQMMPQVVPEPDDGDEN